MASASDVKRWTQQRPPSYGPAGARGSMTQSAQTTPAKPAAKPEAKPKKELTAQQQKMKDCGAKWQDEKKAKNVKGRDAYRKFLSTCLKG